MSVVIPSLRAAIAVPPWVKSELWRKARAVPSLDLRFADNKSLTDAVTGASLVTFTRASNGTYTDSAGVLQTAATDVPRFDHNPTTGESLGLLVEEARTNLVLRSEEFDTANWTKLGSTVTPNATSSPTGATTADKLVESATNAEHLGRQTVSGYSAGAAVSCSIFVKAAERTSLKIRLLDTVVNANGFEGAINTADGTTAGSSAGTGTFTSVTATNVGNSWWKIVMVGVVSSTSISCLFDVFVLSGNASSSTVYAGNGTSGIFLWGAQLEQGAFATSPILTSTAAATRNADVAEITGSAFSGWYRQDEGTVFAECAVARPVSGGNQFVFRTSDNSFNNQVALNIQGSGFASIATAAGGVFDGAATSPLALSANTAAKFAGAYAANNLGVSLNGATAVTDTSATMPTALTRADIGSDHIGANRVKAGTIKRLCYWPTRLANSTLQALSQ